MAPRSGFSPVHTWLPDAHSEAPTPVSALLSGLAARGQLLRDLALLLSDRHHLRFGYWFSARCAAGLRGRIAAIGRAVPAGPAGSEAAAGLLQRSSTWASPAAIGVSFGALPNCPGLRHVARSGPRPRGQGERRRWARECSPISSSASKQISSAHRGAMDVLPWTGPLFLLARAGAVPDPAAVRDLPERVPGGELDVRARSRLAGDPAWCSASCSALGALFLRAQSHLLSASRAARWQSRTHPTCRCSRI